MLTYPSVIEGLKDINYSVEQARQLLKQYEEEMYQLKETIATMGLEVVNDNQADEIILLKAGNYKLFNGNVELKEENKKLEDANEKLKAEVKELLRLELANRDSVCYWRSAILKVRGLVNETL